jgi:uncharacterized protein YlxW (UPF0749 family)
VTGVIVTVNDGEYRRVTSYDLLQLLNQLRSAGAEAISINDQRVVYDTYIVDINNAFIQMSGGDIRTEKLSAPYVVKVIGDPTYLESAISQKTVRI